MFSTLAVVNALIALTTRIYNAVLSGLRALKNSTVKCLSFLPYLLWCFYVKFVSPSSVDTRYKLIYINFDSFCKLVFFDVYAWCRRHISPVTRNKISSHVSVVYKECPLVWFRTKWGELTKIPKFVFKLRNLVVCGQYQEFVEDLEFKLHTLHFLSTVCFTLIFHRALYAQTPLSSYIVNAGLAVITRIISLNTQFIGNNIVFNWGFNMGQNLARNVQMVCRIFQAVPRRNTNNFIVQSKINRDKPCVTKTHRNKVYISGVRNGQLNFEDYNPTYVRNNLHLFQSQEPMFKDGFVFSPDVTERAKLRYKGLPLPESLYGLTFDMVPNLLASFRNLNTHMVGIKPQHEMDEWRRQINLIKHKYHTDVHSYDILKDILFTTFENVSLMKLEDSFQHPLMIAFDNDLVLQIPLIPNKYIGRICGVQNFNCDLYHFFRHCHSRSRICGPKVIKTIIKQQLQLGTKVKDIIHLLHNKLPMIPESFTYQKMCSQYKYFHEDDLTSDWLYSNKEANKELILFLNTYSWIISYLPSVYYHYEAYYGEEETFFNKFKDMLREFLYTILPKFVESYANSFSLSTMDQIHIAELRKDIFINYMQLPEYQILLETGTSQQDVCDIIYKNHKLDIDQRIKHNDTIVRSKIRTIKLRKLDIQQNRDIKYDDSFETESLIYLAPWVALIVTQYIFWDVISKKIKDTFKSVVSHFVIKAAKEETIKKWTDIKYVFSALTSKEGLEDDKVTIRLVQIQALLLASYYYYVGQFTVSLSHFSYLFTTERKFIVNNIFNFGQFFQSTKPIVKDEVPFIRVPAGSHIYEIPPEQYGNLKAAFASGGDVDVIFAKYRKNGDTKIITPQSKQGDNYFVDIVSKVLSSVSCIGLSESDLRKANMQFTFVKNMNGLFTDSYSLLKQTVCALCRILFGYDPCDNSYQGFANELVKCIEFVVDLEKKVKDMSSNVDLMYDITQKYDAFSKLQTDPRMVEVPPVLARPFLTHLTRLKDISVEAANYLKTAVMRAEPVAILFTGTPGVGKTSVMAHVQKMLMHMDGKEYDSTMSFEFNPDSEYWEGYARQPIVILDDMFKADNVDIRRREAQNIISMVNTATYRLNMAFGGKGNTFFDSKYIFCTTNIANDGIKQANFSNVGLTDPNAMIRRWTIVVHKDPLSADVGYDGKIETVRVRVDKCFYMRELEGQEIAVGDLVQLIYLARQWREKNTQPEYLSFQDRTNLILATTTIDFKSVTIDPYNKVGGSTFKRLEPTESFESLLYKYNKITYDDETSSTTGTQGSTTNTSNSSILQETKFKCETYDLEEMLSEHEPEYKDINNPEVWYKRLSKLGLFKWYHTEYAYIFCIIFVVLILIVTYRAFAESFVPELQSAENNSDDAGFNLGRRASRGETNRSRAFKPTDDQNVPAGLRTVTYQSSPNVKPSLGLTPNSAQNYNDCLTRLSKSVLYLKNYNMNKNKGGVGVGYHIKDRYVMTTQHWYGDMDYESGDLLIVTLIYKNKVHNFEMNDFVRVAGMDFVVFKLPTHDLEGNPIDQPTCLYPYCVNDVEMPYLPPGADLKLITSNEDCSYRFIDAIKSNINDPFSYHISGDCIILEKPLVYHALTKKGDSGAPIFTWGKQGKPIFLGIHVGVGNNGGYAAALVVTRNLIDHMLNNFECQSSIRLQIPHTVCGNVDVIHFAPMNSKIIPTPMHGVFGEPHKIPAALTPNAMVNAMKKMHQVPTDGSNANIEVDNVLDYLFELYPPDDKLRFILDDNESLNGVIAHTERDIDTSIPSIKYGTSAGYPYSSGGKGKEQYILRDDNATPGSIFSLTSEMQSKLDAYHQLLLNGEQIDVYWADLLKDERRTLEKVQLEKTRLFSACPLHYLILVRKYFLSFVTYVQNRAAISPISVGINPHSVDWRMLYARLNKCAHNGSVVAGDFSNYDGKLPKFVGEVFLQFVNQWYNDGPINARVRELLLEHVWSARHVYGNEVYQVVDGNPSGNPITSIYNSFCNIIMCYTILTQDFGLRENEFELAVYGDDNIITIAPRATEVNINGLYTLQQKPQMLDKYKSNDFTPHFKRRFDMDYTHYSKESSESYDTLTTIRYLGRKFVPYTSTTMLAPLELNVILESCYWSRDALQMKMNTIATIQTMLTELFHFGQEDFKVHKNKILMALKKRYPEVYQTIKMERHTWNDYFKLMYTIGAPRLGSISSATNEDDFSV